MNLIVFSPAYPPHMGGLESHSAEFNKHLERQPEIDKITVLTPHLPSGSPDYERAGKLEIYRYPAVEVVANYPLPLFWKRRFWQQYRSATRGDYSIVVSRTRFFLPSLLALWYRTRHVNTRWVHIEHGSDYVRLSSPFKSWVARMYDEVFGRLIFLRADRTVAISRAVQRFVWRFKAGAHPIINRGIESDEIDKIDENSKLKTRYRGKLIIAFAGRLYKWKGVENSIEAIKRLPTELKERCVFLIVGDGEDYARLRSLAEAPVVFLGAKSRKETIAILKVADIYIHSAHPGGGLSTALLEAMYCGCAIIATPHEGADEVIGQDSGILISDSDADEIAGALETLMRDEGKRKFLSRAGAKTVAAQFRWATNIRKYVELFNELAKESN